MDGYQVALLAPTTILAAQHYATFKERMADFPINIAVISRFLTQREQKNAVARVASGDVSICIGTHRLLSADVEKGFIDFARVGQVTSYAGPNGHTAGSSQP